MTKQFQTIRLEIIADRIENKPTNHKITMSGVTLDEAVDILKGALKKLEGELEIQREKLCVIKP
jgi:hypothetical protein